ncbi:uncharacterized protein LOC114945294 isoform X2 [Nylanderia fulva]|uniref:uncharacterized protein LOC114945294 isoform X2 n=1 Tax=Nylanderia fulva TaxID=613905 RepID=UPI0010FB9140|nr:uncharacterized protein LOC114945294 isoform X2 [Nylanderia fulva]
MCKASKIGRNQIFSSLMCNNQKMEDNSKVICNEALEEIDQNIVKVEMMNCENFETEPLAVNLIPPIEEYNTTTVLPKRRVRHSKKLEFIKLPSPAKFSYCTTDVRLGLWKDRFRPIRPKPLPTAASPLKSKSFGMSPTLNTSTLTPNASVPSKDKTRSLTTVDSKTNHSTNNGDTGNITPATKECKTTNKNVNANLNTMTNSKSLHNTISNKTTSISHKSSVELFFASMAQTVLNLPREVQADIKMQICKIVTMAEAKYSGLQIKTE